MIIYLLCFVLFGIGLYAVVVKKNLIKIIVGVVIMEYSMNLFLVLIGYRRGGVAPIIDKETVVEEFVRLSVDPLPQAMVLTSIVIGLGVIALMVSVCIRLYEKYGTFDITKIKGLRG
jgi:multicomponent Na+:H+ antiporter subunit C